MKKKVKRYGPKIRRIIATKGLMRGKNQVIEGETSFTCPRLSGRRDFPRLRCVTPV